MEKPPFDPSSRNFPYFMARMRGGRGRRRVDGRVGTFETLVTLAVAIVGLALIVFFEYELLFH